ncbi:hypothetical protein NW757_011234 [Fusarium falciforme]|nr:hypothetical protein NW757_011234 [Fusarium falciforme]
MIFAEERDVKMASDQNSCSNGGRPARRTTDGRTDGHDRAKSDQERTRARENENGGGGGEADENRIIRAFIWTCLFFCLLRSTLHYLTHLLHSLLVTTTIITAVTTTITTHKWGATLLHSAHF